MPAFVRHFGCKQFVITIINRNQRVLVNFSLTLSFISDYNSMDVKLVYDALQELDALKFLKVSFKFYMSSTTCSMMSLMESILTLSAMGGGGSN